MLLINGENLKKKYGMKEKLANGAHELPPPDLPLVVSARLKRLFKTSYKEFQASVRRHQKEVSLPRRFKWAIVDQAGSRSLSLILAA